MDRAMSSLRFETELEGVRSFLRFGPARAPIHSAGHHAGKHANGAGLIERSLFFKHGSCHPRSAYFCKWSGLAQRVQSVGEWKEARHTADTAVWRTFYFVGAPHCFSLRLFWAVAELLVRHHHSPLLQA